MPRFRHMPIGSAIGTGSYIFRHYGEEQPAYPDYLCFFCCEAGSTVKMQSSVRYGFAPRVSLEYSTDRENWSEFVVNNTVVTLANIGDKVYLRGNNTVFGGDPYAGYNYFKMTGKIAASGNVMSLFDKTCQSVAFSEDYACALMFSGCTPLVTAPNLPATTLKDNCYQQMFSRCTSLLTAPDLPATTLKYNCYSNMFNNCENLQNIKVGFSDWGYSYNWMTSVSSSGTFVCPSTLDTSIRDASHIPVGWTVETF